MLMAGPPLAAEPAEEALQAGKEALAKGDSEAAKRIWLEAYNERAKDDKANDEASAKLLEQVGPLLIKEGDAVTARQIFERLFLLRQELGNVEATTMATTAVTLSELIVTTGGDTTRAEQLSRESARVFEEAGSDFDGQRFEALLNVAYAIYGRRDRIGAQSAYLEALEFGKGRPGVDPEGVAVSYRMLASIAAFFGRNQDARVYATRGLDYLKGRVSKSSEAQVQMMLLYADQLPEEERLAYFHSAIAEMKQQGSSKPVSMALSLFYQRLAALEFKGTNRPNSLPYFQQALHYTEKGYGAKSSAMVQSLLNLAKVALTLKDYDEGVTAYRRILKIRTELLGAEHADTIATRKMLDTLQSQIAKVKD
jgi:tetratricopeptide (TPR) repeat protein